MSLAREFEKLHGPVSKIDGLSLKMRTISSDRYLRTLISRYVDENTKSHKVSAEDIDVPADQYPELVAAGEAPQRPGIDFVITTGTVRTNGFLTEFINRFKESAAEPNPEDWQELLYRYWRRERLKKKKQAHHFVFSMDPRFSLALGQDGIPVDDIMQSTVLEALTAFNYRYYPGQSLGWLSGLHHDRIHVHAHVLLFPTTSSGRPLSVSNASASKINGQDPLRIDYLSGLMGSYKTALARHLSMVRTIGFPNPEIRRSRIVEFTSGLNVARSALIQSGEKVTPDSIVRSCNTLLDSGILTDQLNSARDELASTTTGASKEARQRIRPLIENATEYFAQLAQRLAEKRRECTEGFKKIITNPKSFRTISYHPHLPSLSRNSTRSYLDILGIPDGGSGVTHQFIQDRIISSVATIDNDLKEMTSGSRRQRVLGTQEIDTAIHKLGVMSMAGAEYLDAYRLDADLPRLAYEAKHFNVQRSFGVKGARAMLSELLGISYEEAAMIFRTATFEELEQEYRRRRMAYKTGQMEDVVHLTLPQLQHKVVTVDNLFVREAKRKTIRSVADMFRESDELLKQLEAIQTRSLSTARII